MLQADLDKAKAEKAQLQEEVQNANSKATHDEFAQRRAMLVMKDVQVAEDKARHTEDIIKMLLPRLQTRKAPESQESLAQMLENVPSASSAPPPADRLMA